MKSAFAPFDERLALINSVLKPGFARLAAMSSPFACRSAYSSAGAARLPLHIVAIARNLQ